MKKLIVLLLCAGVTACLGQDAAEPSSRNQVIKIALTPNAIYSNAYVLSYERVMKPYQTLGITAGFAQFPDVFRRGGRFIESKIHSRNGFMAGAEYRFYMKKENKYGAPRGVYIGPYFGWYQFAGDRDIIGISGTTGNGRLVTDIAFMNLGGQIGYQFVVNDRWAFDFIFFGPAISNYKLNLDLQGTFTIDEEHEIVNEIIESFPLLKDLIDGKTLTAHGSNSKWAPGYRFTALVGYKFGFRKK